MRLSVASYFVNSRGVSRLGMNKEHELVQKAVGDPQSVELVLNLGREGKGMLRLTNAWVESSGAVTFWCPSRERAEKWKAVTFLGGWLR